MKRIVVFLLAVCFAVPAVSANFHAASEAEVRLTNAGTVTGTVTGSVKTADGKPVQNARLVITGESLTEPMSALSNGFGIFTFPDLPEGAYTIKATAKGYTFAEETQTFNASNESAVELSFTATPE